MFRIQCNLTGWCRKKHADHGDISVSVVLELVPVAAARDTTSGLGMCYVIVLKTLETICKLISTTYFNLRLRYNYFRFAKRTSAILEFYFPFRFRPYFRNPQVILHQPVKFYRNQASGHPRWSIDIVSIFRKNPMFPISQTHLSMRAYSLVNLNSDI